ncbi:MAG: MBL fold metallo-hydrolase [Spirochaetes bacterium]|nr:MBL fold metallo-hydrolase [Spirochaetota bacterium]
MSAMQEVAPDIFCITEKSSFGAIRPPVNIYVIAGSDGLIYDAGYGTKSDVAYFVRQFKDIERIVRERGLHFNVRRILPSHAHPDHFSGIVPLCRALNLKSIVTKSMVKIICSRDAYRNSYNRPARIPVRFENNFRRALRNYALGKAASFFYEKIFGTQFISNPDIVLEDSDEIEINGKRWHIIHSPGHSEDHISLYNEETGVLFSGDNVLRSITTWLGPPKSSLRDYLQTLERLRALPHLTIILSAHGSPITNPKDRISEIIQWRGERTLQVLQLIKDSGTKGISVSDMLKFFYERESWIKHRLAEGWIIVTLEYLVDEGLITYRMEGANVVFIAK